MAPVRLYVGGLPPDVSEEQLRARFTPFGAVSSCSLAPPKVYGGASFPRNFGHVELEPKDEAALRRCISAYNGCRWKGALLKCALARPHYLERLRQPEQEKEVLDEETADEDRPPLGPGSVLRLRPPKAPGVVEVSLGSGAKQVHFPEPKPSQRQQQQGGAGCWEPLPAPPRSGYRFEALLQRIAANPPAELLAAVEARRERGRQLAEAREREREEAAGTEVAYQYSEDSGASASLELDSEDDAATAAAAAAAAMVARERRMASTAVAAGAQTPASARPRSAAAAATTQQQERRQELRAPRLAVVDFAAGEGRLLAGNAAVAAADLSRFDSDADSDADPAPAPASRARPALAAPPSAQPKGAREQQQRQQGEQRRRQRLVEPGPPEPSASSGSSGGSELEEWLAAEGASGFDSDGDSRGGVSASDDSHSDSQLGPVREDGEAADGHAPDGDGGAASSGSSGGSELEEWLAVQGEVQGSDGGTGQEAQAAAAGREAEETLGGNSDGDAPRHATADAQQQAQEDRAHQQQQQPLGQSVQQRPRTVVDFLEEGGDPYGRQWWRGAAPQADLRRFASSDEEEGGNGQLATAGAPHARIGGQRRQRPEAPQLGGRAKRLRVIPQVDGAADSSSSSSSSDSGSSDSGSSDSGSGSGEESSASEGNAEATSSGGSGRSSGSRGSDEVGDEGDAGTSSSSSEEEGEEGEGQRGAKPARRASEAAGGPARSASSDEDEDEEDAAASAAMHEAAARRAEEAELQQRLSALFPEGAAFVRSEPLAQIEAAWRVNRDGWVQDFRQKHRQAMRLVGRAAGGGGKRQRKG